MINNIFHHIGGQHIHYSLMLSSHSSLIILDASTKIVDTPLMLILGDSSDDVDSFFGCQGG